MPDQLQLRGGTTVQHSTFTGASKEVTVDTTKKTAVVHDGSTVGGNPLMREDASNSALALGSAATPSLKFTGDTNTGIYSPGADQVAISTGGSGKIFIAADGKLGVLTASPATALSVAGGISGTAGANISGSGWGVLPYVTNSLVVDSTAGQTRLFATGTDASTHGTFVFFTGTTDGTALERARIDSSGRLLVGTSSDSGGALLQVNGDRVRIGTAKTPASASATGTTGEICWDANYIYVCTATNTWKRTAIATW